MATFEQLTSCIRRRKRNDLRCRAASNRHVRDDFGTATGADDRLAEAHRSGAGQYYAREHVKNCSRSTMRPCIGPVTITGAPSYAMAAVVEVRRKCNGPFLDSARGL